MEIKKLYGERIERFSQLNGTATYLIDTFVYGNKFDVSLKIEHDGKAGNLGDIEALCIRSVSNDESKIYETSAFYRRWEANHDFNLIDTDRQAQNLFLKGEYVPSIWELSDVTNDARYTTVIQKLKTEQVRVIWDFKLDDIFKTTRFTLHFGDSWNNHIFHWTNKIPDEIVCLAELIQLLNVDIEKFRHAF